MADRVGSSLRSRAERFVAGGDVLGRDADGRVVFLRGGVPGDDATVTVIGDRGSWCRGIVTEIHTPGPERVEPPCPQRRAGCGGCDWQHVAVGAQLASKADIVRDALRRTGRLPDAVVTIGATVPDRGYRTSLRVHGAADGRAAFRKAHSHDTVPAAGCLVAHPGLHPVLDSIRLTEGLEVSLRVSAATGDVTARWNERAGTVEGLPDGVRCGPSAYLVEHVGGRALRVSAASFFQSGQAGAELLVDAVRRAAPELGGAAAVADLYSGIGLIVAMVTDAPTRIVAVESALAAVADAEVNLAGRDASVERVEVAKWRSEERFDVVVADPARPGLGRPGVAAVGRAQAPVVVLVSCDPVSMARDTDLLAGVGYRHAGTEVLDLFPHTHHVECVTRYERA